jgi:hypothetical protein
LRNLPFIPKKEDCQKDCNKKKYFLSVHKFFNY